MDKQCYHCKIVKDVEAFAICRAAKDGRQSWCRTCIMARQKADPAYKEKHAAAHQRRWLSGQGRNTHLLKTFGITLEQYNEVLAEQGGVCAICKRQQNCMRMKNLAVDHNHKTGKVRGLLCGSCNCGIGHLSDNPEVAMAAAEYLKRHNQKEPVHG